MKEEVKRLEGELRSRDQGIEALVAKIVDLVNQVMSWEAEAITARDSLKKAELSRSEDIANAVDEALAKFKSSNEFSTTLKKDHDTRFDARVEAIFYNIWTHYRDLDYAFLGTELTDFIWEWIEEKRLSAPNGTPPPVPSDPLTRYMEEIEILSVETSEQSFVIEMDEVTVAPDPPIAHEVPVTDPSSNVVVVQLLINLEEEPLATDVEEETEAAANYSAV